MRFTVRSLGGKLVISAALMLLLCMLLFSVTSWYVLKSFYEHEARSDARMHLMSIHSAYQTRIIVLKDGLITEAANPAIVATLINSKLSARAFTELAIELATAKQKYHLALVSIISKQGKVLIGDFDPSMNVSLKNQATSGET